MKLLRTASHLALTSAILSGLAIAAPAAAQDAAPMADEAEDGGEIVVTARRREESLQDVPISVTAISGDQLEATGAVDITVLQQQAPNMTMQIARGSNSTLIGFIRGVGQQDPLWGFEPASASMSMTSTSPAPKAQCSTFSTWNASKFCAAHKARSMAVTRSAARSNM